MKNIKHLTSVIAFICSINLFSQINVYKPFPTVYGHWYINQVHYSGSLPNITQTLSYHDYIAFGDTTVGLYTYKKVTCSDGPNPFNFGPRTYRFAYRNDISNKKIYYLAPGTTQDTLWYDFNLSVGDTVKKTFATSQYNYFASRYKVTSIDSILICGVYHKQFNFNCTSPMNSKLVEGIGFLDYFINTYSDCPFEPVDLRGIIFSSCDVGVQENSILKDYISVYPNPTNAYLNIKTTTSLELDYAVYNLFGQEVLKGELNELQTINVSHLSNGLYMIKIQDKLGNTYQSKFIKQ